jgi:hypothetical protein
MTMKNNTLRVILYGLTWFLGIVSLTLAVDAALLRSKQPDILFWSGKKLLFCTGVSFLGLFALCIAQKFQPTFKSDANRSLTPEKVFIFLLGIVFLSQLKEPATTAGDLEFQMEGLRQYVRGDVNEFNSLRIPIKNGNLAEDRVEPIIWYPPGTMILLLPWLKLGVPSDWAARILMVSALACGGVGFLRLATKLNIGLVARFAFSVVLALVTLSRDGLGTSAPTSVDNIGMATFPWIAIASLKLIKKLQGDDGNIGNTYTGFLLVGLSTGSLYLIKYSWFVAGAALAGFTGVSAFVLVRKIPFSRRLGVMTSYSLGFITPFLILNHYNETRAGYDALKYNEKGGIGDTGFIDFLYGPNFSATAQASQLPFSIFAGPGFLLGGNHLATKTVQMVRQEPAFVQFFEKRKTNAHVWALILICLPLSFVTFYIFGLYSKDSHAENVLFLVCMALIPIIILAYLSLKTGFNYIIKDNYRYVIPYSLLFQALLLDVWFEKIKRNSTRATQIFFSLVLFWVIIFPNAWALKQHAKRWTSPALDSNKTHIQAWDKLQTENPAGKSITFILNGHGPRTEGLDGRLVCVPFLLNGGIESDPSGAFYHTSEPIRVIIAVEQNLSTRHKGVKQFLNKFPDIEWEINPLPNSVFPEVLYADLGYNQRQILDHAPCN